MFSNRSTAEHRLREQARKKQHEQDAADRQVRQERYDEVQARRAELLPTICSGVDQLFKQQEKSGWPGAKQINRRDVRTFTAIFFGDDSIYAVKLKTSMYYPEGSITAHIWLATDGRLYYYDGWRRYEAHSLKSMETWLLESLFKEFASKEQRSERLP